MTGRPRRVGLADGFRLAVTTFTVTPVRAGAINRDAAHDAMALAPAVGAVLGAAIAGLALWLHAASCPPIVTGLVAVGALAVLTRGLHLDGLADTVDGLASYQPAERARQIMKSPEVGPMGVVALIVAVTVPAGCIAALLDRPWWAVLAGIISALAAGRAAVTFACRRGVPAAAPDGLGALVAGTVGLGTTISVALATAAVSIAAVPGRPWQGPIVVAVALGASVLLVRHATRRIGGVTGDILGACVEVATTVTFVGLVIGG